MEKEKIHIRHACNEGEYVIPGCKKRPDGYCETTNTIYEFYGDYWHGNPRKYKPENVNPHCDRTFGELYQRTLASEEFYRSKGYTVVSIWEMDYKNGKK